MGAADGGDIDEAVDLDTAQRIRTVSELQQRGDAALATGELTKAMMSYTQAVDLDRRNDSGQLATLLAARSTVRLKQGHAAAAEADVQRCAEIGRAHV